MAIKREDELHPNISGNKYRKLKYNLQKARELNYDTLLTFGGAYSNHIAATAAAGNEFSFKTIGIIRGDELALNKNNVITQNPTLKFASEQGMTFQFVSRMEYRKKNSKAFIDRLNEKYGSFYQVPEGGTNELAIRGCEEILNNTTRDYDFICCAVGTGGTISGIINTAETNQKIIGFPALKGDFLNQEIKNYVLRTENWSLNTEYHFGGYAKINTALVNFINKFKKETSVPLDPVYTGKMMYGIFQLIKKGYFSKGSKILAIHTGGLQGIEGMNAYLRRKNLPLLV
jgi:1-aminocyclopropane-1-carboxylate deaminase